MCCRWRFWALLSALTVSLVVPGLSAEPKKPKKKTVPAVKLDESAEHVDVFKGIEKGLVEVKMIPNDPLGGNLFIENKGDKPLNVDFPAAFIGRPVRKQFGQGGGGGGFGGLGGGQGGGQQGGQGQTQGGGVGGGGQQGGGFGGQQGGGGGGGGFFSVPPDRVIRVAYRSVCLEHGKRDPHSGMSYELAKLEEFSQDPVLEETLKMVATGHLDSQSAQAAAWHLTNKMSWKELDAKVSPHVGRPATKYFATEQLLRAQQIVGTAAARAKERGEKKSELATTGQKSPATVKRD